MENYLDYINKFMKSKKINNVVGISSELNPRIAYSVSENCNTFYYLNFKEDVSDIQKKLSSNKNKNIRIIVGNAFMLPKIMEEKKCKLDLILLSEAYLTESWKEAYKFWQRYHCFDCLGEEEINIIPKKIEENEKNAYFNFLTLTNPGYIIRLDLKEREDSIIDLLINKLKINPQSIESNYVLNPQDTKREWVTHTIYNNI